MRVIEVSDRPEAAAWCGLLLVRAGADVVKVTSGPLDPYLDAGKRVGPPGEADLLVTDGEVPADAVARVRVHITPYGEGGPYAGWKATAATLLAHGGYTHLMGDPGRAPLTMPGDYPWFQAGTFAYVAAIACLLREGPATVEVGALECLATLHQFTDVMWTAAQQVRRRNGNRFVNLHPISLYPCKDGWFAVNILEQFWFGFAHMMGRPDLAEDHALSTNLGRIRARDEVDEVVTAAFASWPRRRVLEEGQGVWRVPIGELQTLQDTLEDPHLAERCFWQSTPEGVRVPGSPYRVLQLSKARKPPPRRTPPGRTLEGLRVLDLTHIWAGPLATRLLADLGADVIKVESPLARGPGVAEDDERPPGLRSWNAQPLLNKLARNKRSVAMDLKSRGAREAFLRLVARSDVVIENFSARVMPSFGLGYETLRDANPGIVYVTMPAFGLSGPYREYVGLGPSLEPMTGLGALMGYSDDEPRMTSKAVTDAISGTFAAAAVMTALERRAQTGEGSFVELSQHECGVAFLGRAFVERQRSGREPRRTAHGVYRCAGEDEWICIDAEPEALVDAAAETERYDKLDLAARLQSVGIAAAPVLSAPEWLSDPHLEARGYFTEVVEPDAGPKRYDGIPIRIDGARDTSWWRASPMLGEHNESILREVAGLTSEEIAALVAEGVIAERP